MGRKSVLAAGFVVFSLFASGLYTVSGWLTASAAQSPADRSTQAVVVRNEKSDAPSPKQVAVVVSEAAAKNRTLATGIEWPFGGRTQKGWSLYAGLIGYVVNTDAAP